MVPCKTYLYIEHPAGAFGHQVSSAKYHMHGAVIKIRFIIPSLLLLVNSSHKSAPKFLLPFILLSLSQDVHMNAMVWTEPRKKSCFIVRWYSPLTTVRLCQVLKFTSEIVFVIRQIWIQVGALLLYCVTLSRHLISVYLSFFICSKDNYAAFS